MFRETPLGLKFVRRISGEKGDSLVAQKKAIRYSNPDTNECLGYELIVGDALPAKKFAVPPTTAGPCVVLSKAEVEAIAGLRGKSRTGGMPEHARVLRLKRNLPEMDLVESAKRKFHAMFPDRTEEPEFS